MAGVLPNYKVLYVNLNFYLSPAIKPFTNRLIPTITKRISNYGTGVGEVISYYERKCSFVSRNGPLYGIRFVITPVNENLLLRLWVLSEL